jgi:membrane associated rhomboid family serine protease
VRRSNTGDLSFRLGLVIGLVALVWVVSLVNLVLFGGRWLALGVRSHDPGGLWPDLLFAPLLHVSWAHLLANTVPFLVLGGLVAVRSPGQFVAVTLAGIVGSGVAAWLLGPTGSVHVGASGLVFAYFGWLIARAFRERSLVAIACGAVAAILYGGVLWGLSPFQIGVSWEAHLGGLLAGVAVAQVGGRRPVAVDRMAPS